MKLRKSIGCHMSAKCSLSCRRSIYSAKPDRASANYFFLVRDRHIPNGSRLWIYLLGVDFLPIEALACNNLQVLQLNSCKT